MSFERSFSRRRFVSLAGAFGLAVLAGCTDDEGDGGDEANGTEDGGEGEDGDRTDGGNETEADEENGMGEENDTGAVNESEDLPEVEGTNVFIEVVDEEGVPVPGVTVTVTGGEYDAEGFETDASGGVILQDVEPGDYTITATTEGGEDEVAVSLEEDEDANVTLSVPAPEEGENA